MSDFVSAISSKEITENNRSKQTAQNGQIHIKYFKLILIAMTMTGCYGYDHQNNGKSVNRWSCKIIKLYRLFYLLVCIVFIAKCCVAFTSLDSSKYMLQTIVLLWAFENLSVFLFCLRANSNVYGKQKAELQNWSNDILPEMQRLGLNFDEIAFEKRRNASILIMVVVFFVLGGTQVALMVTNLADYNALLAAPFSPNGWVEIFGLVPMLMMILLNCVPTFYVIIVCFLMRYTFAALNMRLSESLGKKENQQVSGLEDLRQLHTRICSQVAQLDDDLKYLFGCAFFWKMLLALYALYSIIKYEHDVTLMVTIAFWILGGVTFLAGLLTASALVHEAAHAPLDVIYNINAKSITPKESVQLQLFLSKLTGTQIGFTTCGLLVITKEFILTIAGAFLTYFAVLYTL